MKLKYILLSSLVIASALFFIIHRHEAYHNLLFHLNLYDKEKETAALESAIRQYNKNSASFYNSAGFLAGLEEIPAAPLLKRRLVKDITMLKGDGLVMVFDRDDVKVTKTFFLNRDFALAETREVWAVALQDVNTRAPVSTLKAVDVKARYLFHREQFLNQGKKWIAREVDVYPKDEDVPELNVKPVL